MLVRVKLLSSSIVVITRLCQQKLIVLQVALKCEIAWISTDAVNMLMISVWFISCN